jgi:hypothetical protein
MTFKQRDKAIRKLPYGAQLAFAARVAERALDEARKLRPALVSEHPSLQVGVDLIWRQALQQDLDFEQDVQEVHDATSELIPVTVDEDRHDDALRFAAEAISAGLVMIDSAEEPGEYAVIAGTSMNSLVQSVYKDVEQVEEGENQWQDAAIELLAAKRDKSIVRSMLDKIPEYDRGPVSESYRTGSRG